MRWSLRRWQWREAVGSGGGGRRCEQEARDPWWGEKEGGRIFSNAPPLVTGYDFANFSGLEKFRLPCERLKHPLFSLPNLDLWKFWKNSLLNIYKSEARIFSLKRNFSFFFTKIFLYIPFVFLSRIIDSRDNYRGIKSRIVGPTGRRSLHKYEDDVRELEHRGHENAMKIALRRRNAV